MFNLVVAHTQQVTEDMWERRFKSFNIDIPELEDVLSGYKGDSHPHVVDVNPVNSKGSCTPPTTTNSGYKAAKKLYDEYTKSCVEICTGESFGDWCERLHSEEKPPQNVS